MKFARIRILAAIVLAALSIPALAQSQIGLTGNAGADAQAYVAPINFAPQYFSTTSPYSMGLNRTIFEGQPIASAASAIPTQGSPIACYKPGAALGGQTDKWGFTASLGALFGLADDELCDIGRAKNIVQEVESIQDQKVYRLAKRIACRSAIIADAYEAEDLVKDRCETVVRAKDRNEQERAARDPRNRRERQAGAAVGTPVAAANQPVWLP